MRDRILYCRNKMVKRNLILMTAFLSLLFFAGCSHSKRETETEAPEDFWIYLLWETPSEYEVKVVSGTYKNKIFEGYAVVGSNELKENTITRFLFQRRMFEEREIDELTVQIEIRDHENQLIKETEIAYPYEEVFGKTQFIKFKKENDKPLLEVFKLTELQDITISLYSLTPVVFYN